jgi:hypothetical protein
MTALLASVVQDELERKLAGQQPILIDPARL